MQRSRFALLPRSQSLTDNKIPYIIMNNIYDTCNHVPRKNEIIFDKLTAVRIINKFSTFNPYPTAFPYGNGMVLHFYQQQETSTTKIVHKVINKRLKAYV